jgi:large subunit ribosomal protein L4
MKTDIIKLDGKKSGSINLSEAIFGLESRADILHRMVNWQLAKRRAGTHAVKFRADIAGTTKRIGKQKGGGTARHGAGKVSQFRSGGRAFGPIVRDHSHKLTKKFRVLGLKTALSDKLTNKKLIIIDDLAVKKAKTSDMIKTLEKLGLKSALFIDGPEVNENFALALSNVPHMDVLPSQGVNVYDILRRDTLVLTKAAVEKLEERFK